MRAIDIQEAKTHLACLVDEAAAGNPFIIQKAGKPLVKVTALDSATGRNMRRLGFLAGEFTVPDDFDDMGAEVVASAFNRAK